MTFRTSSFVFLAAAALSLSACGKKKAPEPPAPVVQPPSAPPVTTRMDPPVTRPPATDNSAADAAARAAAAKAAAVKTLTAVIYFDYDKSELRDDARATLDSKAPVLRSNPEVRIRIAGHTDERGSAEYNLALGQKRAAAARRYLVGLGVTEGQIDIVSFGEERPSTMGEGEESWSKNRRDEFEVVAGADRIRASNE